MRIFFIGALLSLCTSAGYSAPLGDSAITQRLRALPLTPELLSRVAKVRIDFASLGIDPLPGYPFDRDLSSQAEAMTKPPYSDVLKAAALPARNYVDAMWVIALICKGEHDLPAVRRRQFARTLVACKANQAVIDKISA